MEITTKRLIIREIIAQDEAGYIDLMTNPKVMLPIPAKPLTEKEAKNHLTEILNGNLLKKNKKVMAIQLYNNSEFIGLCAFLKNTNNDDEIGFRLREKFWGNGFAKETAKAMIEHLFNTTPANIVTADVSQNNDKSINVLEKFMQRTSSFYNEDDKTWDYRYEIKKQDYIK